MQKHFLAPLPYTPPQAEAVQLTLFSKQLLESSLTGENYDNEVVYEGF